MSFLSISQVSKSFGGPPVVDRVSLDVPRGEFFSLLGPSGCGKTTLLRCFNRVNERYGYVSTTGEIKILGKNIYDPDVSLIELRKSVGMVFQRPNPLPISVYENVVFGLRIHGERQARKRTTSELRRMDQPAVPRRDDPQGNRDPLWPQRRSAFRLAGGRSADRQGIAP